VVQDPLVLWDHKVLLDHQVFKELQDLKDLRVRRVIKAFPVPQDRSELSLVVSVPILQLTCPRPV
jgi:hypothetical protein